MIGLFKAIRDFQAEKNTAFRAFAELCITRQIITAIKTATRQKHIPLNSYVSLNKPARRQDDDRPLARGSTRQRVDRTTRPSSSSRPRRSPTSGIRWASVLSDLETEVLQLYMDGKSYKQIADMLGRHVKSIDNALQRIKRKLEQHILATRRRRRLAEPVRNRSSSPRPDAAGTL